MDAHVAADEGVVVRDTWPYRMVVGGFALTVAVVWLARALHAPSVVPLLLSVIWCATVALSLRRSTPATVASPDGISGLWLRVPREARSSWFSRRVVVSGRIPWDQVESIEVGATARSLSKLRVRLIDGREGEVTVNALTRRGLRKFAAELERARARATGS